MINKLSGGGGAVVVNGIGQDKLSSTGIMVQLSCMESEKLMYKFL